jgi:hypothetical protein
MTPLKTIRTTLVSVICRQLGRCFGLFDIAWWTQYTYIVAKYKINLHSLRNRLEKQLFLKLVQINYIFPRQCTYGIIIVYLLVYILNHTCYFNFIVLHHCTQWAGKCLFVCLMVFNATFNNISAISWQSVLLLEETGENHWPVASHWQTLSHNIEHLALIEIPTHNISDDRHWLHR